MSGTSGRDDLPTVTASFTQQANGTYAGLVDTYDAFFKKKAMTLHITVESIHCKSTGKYVVWFKFSPKSLEDPLWQMFEAVKLKLDCSK